MTVHLRTVFSLAQFFLFQYKLKFIWGMRWGAEKGVEAEKEGTEKHREERERMESVERRGEGREGGGIIILIYIWLHYSQISQLFYAASRFSSECRWGVVTLED